MRPVRRPVNITIVGSRPQQRGLEALARTLGVGGIRFAGFVDQDKLPAYYVAADVFVFPTLKDLTNVARGPSERHLSDVEIATVLTQSDLLIAPYRLVTASGTVVLALSWGPKVVAYDTGALSDVVARDGLVPVGDERQFANRMMAAIRWIWRASADVGHVERPEFFILGAMFKRRQGSRTRIEGVRLFRTRQPG
jgi:glycosyltransferase involved in cell wall biosynthesis